MTLRSRSSGPAGLWLKAGTAVRHRLGGDGVVWKMPMTASPAGAFLGPRSTVEVRYDDGSRGLAYIKDLEPR